MCISHFEKGYQPRTSRAKDEKSDSVTDCHSVLARRKNHFSQLFNYVGLRILSREKYIPHSLWCLNQVRLG